VIADFPDASKICEEILRLDYPARLNKHTKDTIMTLAYQRKER
jgi:hypothetical protein